MGHMLQLHNPPFEQCRYAENAYEGLTQFKALWMLNRQLTHNM